MLTFMFLQAIYLSEVILWDT